MPRYLPGQLLREQLFAFERDRRSYITAMDPDRAQIHHKYFKKHAADRVQKPALRAEYDALTTTEKAITCFGVKLGEALHVAWRIYTFGNTLEDRESSIRSCWSLRGMDSVSNGEEGVLVFPNAEDGYCNCWSPQTSEEICMCNFAEGNVIQDISAGDVKERERSPGVQHPNKLSRQVMKQQLKELLIRSEIILQNSIRLQILSANLLKNSLRLQSMCVIAEDNSSMSGQSESKLEENESLLLENDSKCQQNGSMTQEKGSMTEETSFGSRSG